MKTAHCETGIVCNCATQLQHLRQETESSLHCSSQQIQPAPGDYRPYSLRCTIYAQIPIPRPGLRPGFEQKSRRPVM